MAYGPQKITGTMPFRYHKDDAAWIDAQLSLLGSAERAQVASAYGKAYQQTEDCHDVDYQKAGAARYEANSRLRKYINKKVANAHS